MDLLEFVRDGEKVMLKYIKDLVSHSVDYYQRDIDRYSVEISFFEGLVSNIQCQIDL